MNIFTNYNKLRKNSYRSYWEKRILSEVGYLLELFYDKESDALRILEQALEILTTDYMENEQISVETAKRTEMLLMPLHERAKGITVICAAHAHMDMNWMWGYQETVTGTLDTMRTMLKLMEEYPDFTFSQSQASEYQIMEKYAPELLEQVKLRIKEGRWEVTASTWVENDKNMPNGESMARHLLYTKRYLSKLLDIKEESLNIDFEPDTFGHSYNLPEILQNGGVSRYYHCRGYEGENIYRWRGMSGAEVLVYREPKWYNAIVESDFYEGMPAFCKKYGIDKVLYVYGVGDHGGGPSRRDIERLIDMGTWPLFPVIRFGTYREYYDYLELHKEQFPIVDQELNYIFTGCYTSQSRIKLANRIGEARLTEAEVLESMAKAIVPSYVYKKNLEDAWRNILFNQFHDILPGSGVVETREHAMGMFQDTLALTGASGMRAMDTMCDAMAEVVSTENFEARKIQSETVGKFEMDTAMGAGCGNGVDYESNFGFSLVERGSGPVRYLALFNVTQETRTEPTEIILWDWPNELENTVITDMDGNECPFCLSGRETGRLEKYRGHTYVKLMLWMPVPPLGYTICRVTEKAHADIYAGKINEPRMDYITDAPICLENDKIKAVFNGTTMKCISFIRKEDERELISAASPACGLELITEETSNGMSSWRVGRTAGVIDLNETCCVRPKKICTEGLRKELEYELSTENVKVLVKIHLDEGSAFLDFRLETVWTMLGDEENGIPQLRFQLPLAYQPKKYRYTIPYGVIEREPLAQDVPSIGLGFAVPEDGGSGLCLLSDSKYGFRGDDKGLSLNLLRSSAVPDPYPEVGEHIIHMAVGVADSENEKLAMLSERFIHPIIVRSCAKEPRSVNACRSLFLLKGGILSAIKEAEDGNGFIIRVYNPTEEKSKLEISMPGRKIKVYRTDILEHDLEEIVTGNELNPSNTKYEAEACGTRKENVASSVLDRYQVCSLRVIVDA